MEIEATFTSDSSQGAFPFPFSIGPQTEQALGSGFVVSREGYILTNAHVVSSNGQTVKTVRVVFKGLGSQTKQVSGTVVGADNTSDVALIKVDPSKLGPLDVIPLGNSAGVQPGEPVVAIGNSGGPLIDSSGHVIGINEQIATQSGGNEGLGFAVPIDSAVGVMGQLKKSGSVTYAWLGISGETLTADVAQALGIKTTQGVLVTQVRAGTPAAKAGLKGGTAQLSLQGQTYQVGGDIITAINNTKLSGMDQARPRRSTWRSSAR